jgi:shikimate dehydrogenase
MIGAGGVARAMAFALAEEGVGAISLFDIDSARASALAQDLKKDAGVETSTGGDPAKADIVVNATPLGMKENDPLPCDVARLALGTVVSDVTTKPEITPFLAAARARGLAVTSGRDMFEAQVRLIGAFLGFDG